MSPANISLKKSKITVDITSCSPHKKQEAVLQKKITHHLIHSPYLESSHNILKQMWTSASPESVAQRQEWLCYVSEHRQVLSLGQLYRSHVLPGYQQLWNQC